jgi:site-specific recombinase XerD
MKNGQHKFKVDDVTITLFMRSSKRWQAKFYGPKFPNKGYMKSTGKVDFDEAKQSAERMLAEMQVLQEHGIDPTSKSFGVVANKWVNEFRHTSGKQEREFHQVARRYFIPFFHDMKSLKIDGVKPRDIKDYKKWRQVYWTKGPGKDIEVIKYERGGKMVTRPAKHVEPSDSRIRSEDSVLRKIFNFAVDEEFAKPNDIPTFKSPKVDTKDPNARVAFTDEQVLAINDVIKQRMIRPERDHVMYQWQLLALYWHFGIATGARPPHEITNLKWRHITPAEQNGIHSVEIQIQNETKTGRRPITALPWFVPVLNNWKAVSKFTDPDDYVFAKQDGSRLVNPKKGMENLFEEAGVYENRGVKLTQYCMRHTFINNLLREGINLFYIRTQCGTSTVMIERYYLDKMKPEVQAGIMNSGMNNSLLRELAGVEPVETEQYQP